LLVQSRGEDFGLVSRGNEIDIERLIEARGRILTPVLKQIGVVMKIIIVALTLVLSSPAFAANQNVTSAEFQTYVLNANRTFSKNECTVAISILLFDLPRFAEVAKIK
jgi:hypothetical protein